MLLTCMYVCMTIHLALNNPSCSWRRLNLSFPKNCLLLLPVPWAASSQKLKVTVYCWRHLSWFLVLARLAVSAKKGRGHLNLEISMAPFRTHGPESQGFLSSGKPKTVRAWACLASGKQSASQNKDKSLLSRWALHSFPSFPCGSSGCPLVQC